MGSYDVCTVSTPGRTALPLASAAASCTLISLDLWTFLLLYTVCSKALSLRNVCLPYAVVKKVTRPQSSIQEQVLPFHKSSIF